MHAPPHSPHVACRSGRGEAAVELELRGSPGWRRRFVLARTCLQDHQRPCMAGDDGGLKHPTSKQETTSTPSMTSEEPVDVRVAGGHDAGAEAVADELQDLGLQSVTAARKKTTFLCPRGTPPCTNWRSPFQIVHVPVRRAPARRRSWRARSPCAPASAASARASAMH